MEEAIYSVDLKGEQFALSDYGGIFKEFPLACVDFLYLIDDVKKCKVAVDDLLDTR